VHVHGATHNKGELVQSIVERNLVTQCAIELLQRGFFGIEAAENALVACESFPLCDASPLGSTLGVNKISPHPFLEELGLRESLSEIRSALRLDAIQPELLKQATVLRR
jgi:hypothetical protein